jgi:hypothetical protein
MSLSGKAGCKRCNKEKIDPQRIFLITMTSFVDQSMPLGLEYGIRSHWVRGTYAWWELVR